MIAHINRRFDGKPGVEIAIVGAFEERGALKARGYQFSRDTPIRSQGGIGHREPHIIPDNRNQGPRVRCANPCTPCWVRELSGLDALTAEMQRLQDLGAVIGGTVGLWLHNRKILDAGSALKLEENERHQAQYADIVAAAFATQWTAEDEALAKQILGEEAWL